MATVKTKAITKSISIPEVGKGATVFQGNDRQAYEVIWVSESLNGAIIQRYRPIRLNYRGGEQKYRFEQLEGSPISVVFKNGEWRVFVGRKIMDKIIITFGLLDEYYHE